MGGGALSGSQLHGGAAAGAQLAGADLQRIRWQGVDLAGADLAGASLRGALLIDVSLRGASLAGADLAGATLVGVDLTDAAVAGSRWQRALLFEVVGGEALEPLKDGPPPPVMGDRLPQGGTREAVLALGELLGALEVSRYAASKDIEAALSGLIKGAPLWRRPRWTLGDYYRINRDADAATWAYELSLDLDGGDIYAALQASSLHLERGRPDAALRILGALEIHTEVSRRHEGAIVQHEAAALLARGDVDRARALLGRSLERRPHDVELRVKLAEIDFRQGRTNDALTHLRLAWEQAPHRLDLPRYMAELLADALGMPTDAFALLLHVTERAPDDAEARQMLGRLATGLVNGGVASDVGAPPPAEGDPGAPAFALERAGAFAAAQAALNDRHDGAARLAVAVAMARGDREEALLRLPTLRAQARTTAALTEVAALTFSIVGGDAALLELAPGDEAAAPARRWFEDVAARDGVAGPAVAAERPRMPAPLSERARHWFTRLGVEPAWAESASLALPMALRHVRVGDAGTLDLHVTDGAGRKAIVQLAVLEDQAKLLERTAALCGGPGVHLLRAPMGRVVCVATRDDVEASRERDGVLTALLSPRQEEVPGFATHIAALARLMASGTVPRSGPFLPSLHWWGVLSAPVEVARALTSLDGWSGPRAVLGPLPELSPLFAPGAVTVGPTLATGPVGLSRAAAVVELAASSSFARATGHLIWPERWTRGALHDAGNPWTLAERRWIVGGIVASRALESVALVRRSEPVLGVSAFAAAEAGLRRCGLALEALARGAADRLLEAQEAPSPAEVP